MPVAGDGRWPLTRNIAGLRVTVTRPRQHFLELGLDQAFNEMPDLRTDR